MEFASYLCLKIANVMHLFSPRLITRGASGYLMQEFHELSYWMKLPSSDMKENFQITFKATSETL